MSFSGAIGEVKLAVTMRLWNKTNKEDGLYGYLRYSVTFIAAV